MSYKGLEFKGRGGFGTVYELIGKDTVIKVANKNVTLSDMRERVYIRSIDSPHVVKGGYRLAEDISLAPVSGPYTSGESMEGEITVFQLEKLNPDGLLAYKPTGRTKNEVDRKIYKTIWELIVTVGQLNNLKIYHKDIKPDNILFKEGEDRVVITDFGLATISYLPNYGVAYTWTHRAPEITLDVIFSDSPVDYSKTDIFALGISIIEWLSSLQGLPNPKLSSDYVTNGLPYYRNTPEYKAEVAYAISRGGEGWRSEANHKFLIDYFYQPGGYLQRRLATLKIPDNIKQLIIIMTRKDPSRRTSCSDLIAVQSDGSAPIQKYFPISFTVNTLKLAKTLVDPKVFDIYNGYSPDVKKQLQRFKEYFVTNLGYDDKKIEVVIQSAISLDMKAPVDACIALLMFYIDVNLMNLINYMFNPVTREEQMLSQKDRKNFMENYLPNFLNTQYCYIDFKNPPKKNLW